MATLELKQLNKKYPNGFEAVKGINLEVKDGEFISLLGPSGCGKSTTLRMIAGLEDITSGTLTIGGKIANRVQPKDRGIAMVFQSYALFPHMTVEANIGFGLKLRKTPEKTKREKIDWALDLLNLKEFANQRPAQLSGGQRQRVALGRALVLDPDVLLLDEPLSNLDAKLRVKMRTELKRIHKKLHSTIIYVTHDQEEAMTLSDRIVIMNKGEIMQVGTPLEVYNNPANRFVADFMGRPPFNFLDGLITQEEGGYRFVYETGSIALPEYLVPQIQSGSLDLGNLSLAVRPEDMYFHGTMDNDCLPGVSSVRETLGSEDYIAVEIGGALWKVRVETTADIPMDSNVYLKPKPGKVFLFNKD